jgi:translation initiation factor RLI1
MNKSDKYTAGVYGVVSRASAYNSDIGSYVEHFINEDFKFSVRLSNNGAVTMSVEIAQDQETAPNSISEDRIQAVANSFRLLR